MTAAWRECLDAGMLANFPAGVISKLGGRQNTSDLRLGPGAFIPIETNGMPINQVLMGLPYKDITPGLLSLMQVITEQGKALGSAAEVPVGEGLQNVPVGTMLAQIEQATKMMSAAHKGMHQAQSEEFQMMEDLFRENPEDFWRSNKVCPKDFWNEQKFISALDNCKLVPVSDPNVPSHIHRLMKAVAWVQLVNVPVFGPFLNIKEILLRIVRAMREDPTGVIIDPQPQQQQPDPKVMAAQIKAQSEAAKMPLEMQKLQVETKADAMKSQADTQIARLDLQRSQVDHARDTQKYQVEGVQARHDMQMDQRKQQLDETKAAHDMQMDHVDRQIEAARMSHDAQMAQQQHDLASQQAQTTAHQGEQEHALNVHQALHPPKPAPKPKGKS
jgi:hypothetical protein